MFYKDGDYKRFKGYRVTAIDGKKYNMPNSKEMKEEYGFQGSTNEQPQALGSCLYDVLNGIISLIEMFTYKSQKKRDKMLDNIYHQLLTCVTTIRPGRSFDRNKKHKSQKHPKNRRNL